MTENHPESEASSPPETPDTEPMATDTTPDDEAPDREQPGDEQGSGRTIQRYVRYILLGGFVLLALIALLRFYFAMSATIDTWVASEYRSLFQAAFNLAVLLVAGAGIAWQIRALR